MNNKKHKDRTCNNNCKDICGECQVMSNKKQNHIVEVNKMVTAVEWLFKELLNSEPNILEWNKLLQQGKAMEKEQIENAHQNGFYCGNDICNATNPEFQSAEQYYKEIYGE